MRLQLRPVGQDNFEFTEETAVPATIKPGYAQLVGWRQDLAGSRYYAGGQGMLTTSVELATADKIEWWPMDRGRCDGTY
jgi:hypothetical protein